MTFLIDPSDRMFVDPELAHGNRVARMGQLSVTIAHEVKQPLAALLTNAETAVRWLSGQPPNLEKARQLIGRIIDDGTRAAAIVSRIREFSRKAPTRKEEVDLNDAILEVLALAQATTSENAVSVKLQFSQHAPRVLADRVQLQQVILNLVMNAVEAMKGVDDRPRILLISTRDASTDGVVVEVKDSGPGLPPAADRARIFEAFYTTKSTGLGMGVSICCSIVNAHGGKLWATSNRPYGAAFYLLLPAKKRRTERPAPALSRGYKACADLPGSRRRTSSRR